MSPAKKADKPPEVLVPQKIQPASDHGEFAVLLDSDKFNQAWRVARLYAASELAPAHYRGKTEDTFIALQMAYRSKVDPMQFLQGTYVVQGKLAMEAKLAIGLANSRGPFAGPIQWRMSGEGLKRQAVAYAKHKNGELCESAPVSVEMANRMGWTRKKDGSLKFNWANMPELMLRYRSASWLIRLYAPDCLMGMQTVEEVRDIGEEAESKPDITAPGTHSFRRGFKPPTEAPEIGPSAPATPEPVAQTAGSEIKGSSQPMPPAEGFNSAPSREDAPSAELNGGGEEAQVEEHQPGPPIPSSPPDDKLKVKADWANACAWFRERGVSTGDLLAFVGAAKVADLEREHIDMAHAAAKDILEKKTTVEEMFKPQPVQEELPF